MEAWGEGGQLRGEIQARAPLLALAPLPHGGPKEPETHPTRNTVPEALTWEEALNAGVLKMHPRDARQKPTEQARIPLSSL